MQVGLVQSVVNFYAVVTDSTGILATGLSVRDYRFTEEGIRQKHM